MLILDHLAQVLDIRSVRTVVIYVYPCGRAPRKREAGPLPMR
jgi:hypothetical protein